MCFTQVGLHKLPYRKSSEKLGCIWELPTNPDSGPFHAAPHHFSLKYVSIPAKKCLAQRKNSSLPVTLGVFRYTLDKLPSGDSRLSSGQSLGRYWYFSKCSSFIKDSFLWYNHSVSEYFKFVYLLRLCIFCYLQQSSDVRFVNLSDLQNVMEKTLANTV